MTAMESNGLYKSSDDYYAAIADKYRALILSQRRSVIGRQST